MSDPQIPPDLNTEAFWGNGVGVEQSITAPEITAPEEPADVAPEG